MFRDIEEITQLMDKNIFHSKFMEVYVQSTAYISPHCE
jgi:hypothetical protein